MSKTHFVERDTGRIWSNQEVKSVIKSWHDNPENKHLNIINLLLKKFAIITGESNDT